LPPQSPLSLLDWRRTVAELYTAVRHHPNPADAWQTWRRQRDNLFLNHPQSPLNNEQRAAFTGLPYYEYDPVWRIAGELDLTVTPEQFTVPLPEGDLRYTRIGRVSFNVARGAKSEEHKENAHPSLFAPRATLFLYWLEGYGGGLFLPFGDLSNGRETYGGGRYLYDTIKGADLGGLLDELPTRSTFLLDFNFAYNPSCAYSPRWVCPLAPAENRLPFAVTAGERNDGVQPELNPSNP
jgi:uncharacterized protein (DUF1684 family)